MRKFSFLLALLLLLILSACNVGPINLQATRQAQEAQGTIFPTNTPRATLAFPTPQPTPLPTRALEAVGERSIEVDGYSVSFQTSECQVSVSGDLEMECGNLVVPETRGSDDGRMVTLPVVILRTENYLAVSDPLVYLAGGGGSDALAGLDYYFSSSADFLYNRDYIFYNQRGAPGTSPALFCEGYSEFLRDRYAENISSAEFDQRHVEFLLDCQQQLLDEGINLAAYNSAANAADLNDLRRVLGYEQINIFGSSYGTKLALTAMREYPDMIRSAILDSVYPQEVDLYTSYPENALSAFETVFEECAAIPSCASRYPDVAALFYATVDQLNAAPVEMDFSYGTYVLNGDRFVFNLTNYFYGGSETKNLPYVIKQTNEAKYSEIVKHLRVSWQVDFLSWGMFFSMQCNEEIPFSTREQMAAASQSVPEQLRGFFGSTWRFDLCDQWQSGQAEAIENVPVSSELPTLILAGHYDLETPTSWGEAVSQRMPNSFFYEFPNVGHGVLRSESCALDMALDFIANPNQAPDSACLDKLETIFYR